MSRVFKCTVLNFTTGYLDGPSTLCLYIVIKTRFMLFQHFELLIMITICKSNDNVILVNFNFRTSDFITSIV